MKSERFLPQLSQWNENINIYLLFRSGHRTALNSRYVQSSEHSCSHDLYLHIFAYLFIMNSEIEYYKFSCTNCVCMEFNITLTDLKDLKWR